MMQEKKRCQEPISGNDEQETIVKR